MTILTAALAALHIAAAAQEPRLEGMTAAGDPPRAVHAAGETFVTDNPQVDADDPAIWVDPTDPTRALILGTDKSIGLYVHDFSGAVVQFLASGPVNNVDLRSGFRVNGQDMVLVAATNRTEGRYGVSTYLLDPRTLRVSDYGFLNTDIGEPYGFCMGRMGDDFLLVVTTKHGAVHQWPVRAGAHGPELGQETRRNLETQLEGCVVDDKAGKLYVGEEDRGVWLYGLDRPASDPATLIAAVDDVRIKADVEGLTIMRDGGQDYLIVSSQGDSTFPVYRIEGDRHVYLGRFAVPTANGVDEVTGTDGLDAWSGPVDRFPQGVIVVHDTADDSGEDQQNYKLLDWRDIRRALDF